MRLHIMLAGALAAGVLAAPALAQDTGTLKKIKETGIITIGHRDSSIPSPGKWLTSSSPRLRSN